MNEHMTLKQAVAYSKELANKYQEPVYGLEYIEDGRKVWNIYTESDSWMEGMRPNQEWTFVIEPA